MAGGNGGIGLSTWGGKVVQRDEERGKAGGRVFLNGKGRDTKISCPELYRNPLRSPKRTPNMNIKAP